MLENISLSLLFPPIDLHNSQASCTVQKSWNPDFPVKHVWLESKNQNGALQWNFRVWSFYFAVSTKKRPLYIDDVHSQYLRCENEGVIFMHVSEVSVVLSDYLEGFKYRRSDLESHR